MRPALLLLGLSGSLALAATTTTDTSTSTSTTATSTSTSPTSTSPTSTTTSATSTTDSSTSGTSTSSTSTSGTSTSDTSTSTSGTSTSSSSTSGTSTTSSTSSTTGITVPTMVIPYTADAPFMQKSTLPEGTMFICIGAILGFLGLCVLAWRAMIAYTINRSVKRAALASIRADWDTKKATPIWLGGSLSARRGPSSAGGKMYKQAKHTSQHSLDALTPHGKKAAAADPFNAHRVSVAPSRKEQARDPSSLFFSPTAAGLATAPPQQATSGNRSSSYLPAGYYAAAPTAATAPESPSRDPPPTTALLHPTARDDSRNRSSWRDSSSYSAHPVPPARNPARGSTAVYNHPSTSSLAVAFGQDDDEAVGGAYRDDEVDHRRTRSRGRY